MKNTPVKYIVCRGVLRAPSNELDGDFSKNSQGLSVVNYKTEISAKIAKDFQSLNIFCKKL